jgi:hypothetical protein
MQTIPSVLMDTSNPLFAQVAIFARCLEERQSVLEEQHQLAKDSSQMMDHQSSILRRSEMPQRVAEPLEKRTTRRSKQQKTDETDQVNAGGIASAIDDEKLYLIDPS